ncbi:hypothetical protein D3C71_1526030 [compost metagenome]
MLASHAKLGECLGHLANALGHRDVTLAGQSFTARGDRRLRQPLRHQGQDPAPDLLAGHVGDLVVDVLLVTQLARTFLGVHDVHHGDLALGVVVLLHVPGIHLDFGLLVVAGQLAVPVLEVAVDAGDLFRQADARTGYRALAAWQGVERHLSQCRQLAGIHQLGVGAVQITRETLGQDELTLCLGYRTGLLDRYRAGVGGRRQVTVLAERGVPALRLYHQFL